MTEPIIQARQRWHHFRREHKLFHNPISIIPLITVVLLVGLFIILDAGFVLQPGIMVQLPAANFVSGSHYGSMIVTLTQEGMVFFNDERMPIEGLAFAFKQAVHQNRNMTLIIEADARVSYGMIVHIMNMATSAGIRTVNLATRPPFEKNIK
jgi:biopolymer transport protein ExbD